MFVVNLGPGNRDRGREYCLGCNAVAPCADTLHGDAAAPDSLDDSGERDQRPRAGKSAADVAGHGTGNYPRIAVLSGPTFAREVAAGNATAVVVASSDPDGRPLRPGCILRADFRLYTNDDP